MSLRAFPISTHPFAVYAESGEQLNIFRLGKAGQNINSGDEVRQTALLRLCFPFIAIAVAVMKFGKDICDIAASKKAVGIEPVVEMATATKVNERTQRDIPVASRR